MTEYSAGANSQEFYLYDAPGNRVLKRTISGGSTKLTAYAYGLQELSYTGSGAFSSQTDYYAIAGHLIGSTNGTTTTYDLTDAEGSVLTSLSSSTVLGEQIYGPYGNQRYTQGSMGTDKGYTGQFQDAVSGFEYYNARYYDPVMGQFLSADVKKGNAQGMDPYSYVNGNPETATDPTGHDAWFRDTPVSLADQGDRWYDDPGMNPVVTPSSKNACPSGLAGSPCTYTSGNCARKTVQGCQQMYAQQQAAWKKLQKEKAARRDAANAAKTFHDIANFLGSPWLNIALVAFGIILSASDWALAPFLGGILTGIGVAFAFLGKMAGDFADLFSLEGTDALGQIHYDWFTKAHLQGDESQFNGIILGDGIGGEGGGLAEGIVGFLAAVFKGSKPGTESTPAGTNILTTGLTAAVVTAIAVGAGAIIFDQMAEADIQQEEADVA